MHNNYNILTILSEADMIMLIFWMKIKSFDQGLLQKQWQSKEYTL